MRYASAEWLTGNRSYMVMSTLILIVGLPLAWCLAAYLWGVDSREGFSEVPAPSLR
jgi:hypothetical protein